MGLRLSDASEDMKESATRVCKKWQHFYLSTEHFVMAACKGDDACRAWLERQDLDLEELEEAILEMVPKGDAQAAWDGIKEAPRMRTLLTKDARRFAEKQKANRVEPSHVLASILNDEKGVGAQVFVHQGLKLKTLLADILGKTPPGSSGSGDSGSKKKGKQKTKFLSKYTRDLREMVRDGKTDPVIGRSDEIRRVLQILTRKTKSNPVLIGEAGVGKTAVAVGLAQRIHAQKVPDALKNKKVLELSLSSMIAGAKHRGEFEERLEGITKEVKADPEIVLFIDEIHQLVGAGDSRGGMDASNILKPALARGELRVLGATTTDEYRRYIEKDPALERRFQPVLVGEPSEEEALTILTGLKGRYEQHHGAKFSDGALLAAVKLSVRFLPDRNLPDKAIDLIDESAARVKTRSGVFTAGESPSFLVDEGVVAEVVADWTGIPVSRMTEEETERLLDMESLLGERVVGQAHAVSAVAQTIRVVRVGLVAPNRPSGVFLFLGPSGVGKTELAKALAEFLFGSSGEMVRLDMSEYHDKHSVSRLIGSPPGYVGHDEEGQLTRAVRTKPYSVVLLDEVEKAHPEIFDLFLQVFDDGRLTDSKGRTVNFTNTIVIMTSNLGAKEALEQNPTNEGFAGQLDEMPKPFQLALKNHFRPEFLNRVDELICFRSLEKSDLVGIVEIHLGRLKQTILEQKGLELEISPQATELLLEQGYQPAFGARPLHRAINTHLKRPLAEHMLRHSLPAGTRLLVIRQDSKLRFEVETSPQAEQQTSSATLTGGPGDTIAGASTLPGGPFPEDPGDTQI